MDNKELFDHLANVTLREILELRDSFSFYTDHIPGAIKNDIETKIELVYYKVMSEFLQFQNAVAAESQTREELEFELQQAKALLRIMTVVSENYEKISNKE